ncbi:Acetyl-/propionyl-coenzyme A carboxylase alpha chain [Corynebacterium glyciniphilum AJ 3170]|uniref:biotin carboxylase n=1 Tax=Corynebacterium glyciniphilum AJ 3170 TaxID=1404245 RepID=X5DWM1_9CORY|nr:biotin carboxylase N-terminal domain-containing protein [Corynebacterium glyciniphilum]AHW65017.1 Acetyl-/propionyl-coenzyme A carboxylase alpha chain [Corynebacterium glyciniphilum AJ 3170]
MSTISSVLIANRGEIAVRIARAAHDLGIRTVAVYTDADVGAVHTEMTEQAYAVSSYLDVDALLEVASRAGVDSVHPGYGFLSENADAARAVQDAGLVWVGPSPETIETLGDKMAARQLAERSGAPLAPGTSEPLTSWEQARDFAEDVGLPIAIKAAFGGGGRGLKVVTEDDGLGAIEDAFAAAGRESQEAFGRAECFVEKFLARPRHVEAQVLADMHGAVAVIGTRDCSTQRRFQKLVEEAPAPFLSEEQNRLIVDGAREVCRAAEYVGAGTVEFIVAEDGTVSFLEVNTRLQVEHPVTEAVSGIDIVHEQFRIAAGERLGVDPDADPATHGHAVEFRINAEDVAHGFAPCPGTVTRFEPPTGPGIRVDSGVRSGSTIPGSYDSLLAKLVVWGPDRDTALRRARAALDEFHVDGVRTVLPFHRDIVREPAWTAPDGAASFRMCTDWVDREYVPGAHTVSPDVTFDDIYVERTTLAVEIGGTLQHVRVPSVLLQRGDAARGGSTATGNSDGHPGDVPAPFAGTLVEWKVSDGDTVEENQTLATVEAMKMEATVTSPASGTIQLIADAGDVIARGDILARIVEE